MRNLLLMLRNAPAHYARSWYTWRFRHFYDKQKLESLIRSKEEIRVCFIIHSLGAWKTEELYKAMLAHPRFTPLLVVSPSHEENDVANIEAYLNEKGYAYQSFDYRKKSVRRETRADIIFFQKPYADHTENGKSTFYRNIHSLYCFVNYAFNSIAEEWALNTRYLENAWQIYFENAVCREAASRVMKNHAANVYVTGLPFQDELTQDKSACADPWIPQERQKKRIIWAPHHSIGDGYIVYSTFLEYCEAMLQIAEAHKADVQFAFKPHPLLYPKLLKIWGKERTDEYYDKWRTMSNCQLAEGKYMGLFKYSDAMIHDCSSFSIEYHYTHNPVLYLDNGGDHLKGMNAFSRQAYQLHYKARTLADIEAFIADVIHGVDTRKDERKSFYREFLLPPNNQTASQNIISCILGSDAKE